MKRGILASRDELTALAGRVGFKPFNAVYSALRQRCALILESPPVKERHWQMLWQGGGWHAAVSAARTAQGRILDLLIAHHVDRNDAYRDRAVEELRNLARWSTWKDPCHRGMAADLCTAEAAVAAVIGLDWLWEDLDDDLRAEVLQAIRDKAIAPYRQAVADKAWWYTCYHHWNAVVNAGCGLAALALSDEDDEAAEAHELAMGGLKAFQGAFGKEGGWDEGTGYWGYAIRYVLLLGHAMSRLGDDQRIFHARGMEATAEFPLYFTPNGKAASFGDSPTVPLYSALYLLPRYYPGQDALTWWLDTYAFQHDVINSGWAAAGLALLFRPESPQAPPEPELAPAKVYGEIGWAALADRWPRPGFYVAAKTGDLSANHSQRDMNSIQLQVDGEMLLTDPGNAPPSEAHPGAAGQDFYEAQAVSHNTLTVGQRDHRIDAQGRIVASGARDDVQWVTCHAGTACGENVHFFRHVVMVVDPDSRRGRMLVVLDELAVGPSERVDVYWHTHGKVELNGAATVGTIRGRRAAVAFALASSVEMQCKVESRAVDRGRTESVVHLTGYVSGAAVVGAVFAREKLPGPIGIARTGKMALIDAGPLVVRFKQGKRHLELEKIEYR